MARLIYFTTSRSLPSLVSWRADPSLSFQYLPLNSCCWRFAISIASARGSCFLSTLRYSDNLLSYVPHWFQAIHVFHIYPHLMR